MSFLSSWSCLLLLFSFVSLGFANVEKTIFLAPPDLSIPSDHPNLDDLCLIPLSPLHPTARTRLNASFPTNDAQKGKETWILLDGLTPGARYEVRICWLATQPTAFHLYTHGLEATFESSELITALSAYAYARQAELDEFQLQQLAARRAHGWETSKSSTKSMLFLQIFAAADYFTLNKTLMTDVPPVLVDVILDPYLLNIFPKSLVPTAGYLIVLAIGAWFLSGMIWRVLVQVANTDSAEPGTRVDVAKEKVT